MEQNIEKTSEELGNEKLGNVSWALFTKTGEPAYYCMYSRLTESERAFDANFPPEEESQEEFVQ